MHLRPQISSLLEIWFWGSVSSLHKQITSRNRKLSPIKRLVSRKCVATQSCLTLCNPVDCSPPGSSGHGVLQARILEWVAISFSSEQKSQLYIIWRPGGGALTPCDNRQAQQEEETPCFPRQDSAYEKPWVLCLWLPSRLPFPLDKSVLLLCWGFLVACQGCRS